MLLPDLPPDEDPSLVKTKEKLRKSRVKTTDDSEQNEQGDEKRPEDADSNTQQQQQQQHKEAVVSDQQEEDEATIREQPIKLIVAIHREILQTQANSNITLLSYLKKEDTDKTGFVDTEMFIKAVKRATSKLHKFKKIELSTLDALAIYNHYGKESDGRLDYKKFLNKLNTIASSETATNDVDPIEKKSNNEENIDIKQKEQITQDVDEGNKSSDADRLLEDGEEPYVDEHGFTWSVAPSSSAYATSTADAAREDLERKIVALSDHLAQLSENHWAYSLPPISWAGNVYKAMPIFYCCIFLLLFLFLW